MKIVACSGVMRMMQQCRVIKCMICVPYIVYVCKSKYFISYLQEFHKVFFCGSPRVVSSICLPLRFTSKKLHSIDVDYRNF